MDEVKYKEAVLRGAILEVSNNNLDWYPSSDAALEDVEIKFLDQGIIEVTAKEILVEYVSSISRDPTKDKELLKLVEDKYIIKRKRLFSRKEYLEIKSGYVILKERKSFKLISNGLTIRYNEEGDQKN